MGRHFPVLSRRFAVVLAIRPGSCSETAYAKLAQSGLVECNSGSSPAGTTTPALEARIMKGIANILADGSAAKILRARHQQDIEQAAEVRGL